MRFIVPSCLVLAAVAPAAQAAPAGLAPHRAVYDLSLKEASERSGIEGMIGRMVYEFDGSACDGYTVSFRFVTEIDNGESVRVTDQQTTTYEDLRQHTFDFATKSYVNQTLDHEVKGSASLEDGEIKVELDKPSEQTLELSRALFPTEHLLELIDKAKEGERFYESRIFDGSDQANETLLTATVVGEKEQASGTDPEFAKAKPLADEAYWPVAISYFKSGAEAARTDGLPVYSIAFKLYADGVTRDLTMDYGEFALEGKLAQLEYLKSDPASCPN